MITVKTMLQNAYAFFRMCSVLHDENDEEKEQSRARKRYDVQKSQLAPKHRSSISKCPDDEKNLSDLDNGEKQLERGGAGSAENINLRAAMLHVLGDMVQSVGVVIAAFIIKFKVKTSCNLRCMYFRTHAFQCIHNHYITRDSVIEW